MNTNTLILNVFIAAILSFASTAVLSANLGTWTATGSMNTTRAGFSTTLLNNGKVLVAGGETNSGRTASAEIYNTATGKWTVINPMNQVRAGHTATLLPNGKVLVAGGASNTDWNLATAELYDPVTGKWTLTGNMTTKRNSAIATLMTTGVLSGQVLVAGGNSPCGGGEVTACAEIYNPDTGKWTATGSMTFTSFFSSNALIPQLSNGLLLVIGGDTCCGYFSFSNATLFDPATQKWTATNSKTTDAQADRVLLADGRILVAGGWKGHQGSEVAVKSAELFNPITSTWSATASMSTVRNTHTLSRLANGQVLVVGGNTGGWGQCNVLNTTELYDPSTEKWVADATMATARVGHSAILLPNKKLLVIGGFNSSCGTRLASTELYTPPAPPFQPPIISIDDIDNDTSPEIAAVTYNSTLPQSLLKIRNAKTGVLITRIQLNSQFVPQKIVVLPDLNGNKAPEIAVLGTRDSDKAVQVSVYDSLSRIKISNLPFSLEFTAIDLGTARSPSGEVYLAVLQQSAKKLRVHLKNALTGATVRIVTFNPNYKGIDLEVLPDLNGNTTQELAVLSANIGKGGDKVEIHDSSSGQFIRNIPYGQGKEPKQLLGLPDVNKNGSNELVLLRDGSPRVVVMDSKTGLAVNVLNYALSKPFKLAGVADGTSTTGLALLGIRGLNGQSRADVHDIFTDMLIGRASYEQRGDTVGFISIPDINGNGVSEIVRLRTQADPLQFYAEILDGDTGKFIQGLHF